MKQKKRASSYKSDNPSSNVIKTEVACDEEEDYSYPEGQVRRGENPIIQEFNIKVEVEEKCSNSKMDGCSGDDHQMITSKVRKRKQDKEGSETKIKKKKEDNRAKKTKKIEKVIGMNKLVKNMTDRKKLIKKNSEQLEEQLPLAKSEKVGCSRKRKWKPPSTKNTTDSETNGSKAEDLNIKLPEIEIANMKVQKDSGEKKKQKSATKSDTTGKEMLSAEVEKTDSKTDQETMKRGKKGGKVKIQAQKETKTVSSKKIKQDEQTALENTIQANQCQSTSKSTIDSTAGSKKGVHKKLGAHVSISGL